MKPVPHLSVANIRISEQTTKFYLSFFHAEMQHQGTEPDWFCIMRCLHALRLVDMTSGGGVCMT